MSDNYCIMDYALADEILRNNSVRRTLNENLWNLLFAVGFELFYFSDFGHLLHGLTIKTEYCPR